VTSVTPMLAAASASPVPAAETMGPPHEPVDANLLRSLSAIQRAAGMPAASARLAALSVIAERDEALAADVVVDPPPMSVEAFQAHLTSAMDQLRALRDVAVPRAA